MKNLLWLLLVACAWNCDSEANNEDDAASTFELIGTWDNAFDGQEIVTAQEWDFGYAKSAVTSFDNQANMAVLQNGPTAEFNPNQYSKVVWTEPDALGFFYCTVAFGLETEAAALAAADTADRTDPDTSGCATFPWTKLMPAAAPAQSGTP